MPERKCVFWNDVFPKSGKSCDSVDSSETGDCGESGDLSESGNSGETGDWYIASDMSQKA